MKRAKFVIRRNVRGKFTVSYVAPNGEPVAVGEEYETAGGARKGIASIKRNALLARIVEEI